MSRDCIVCDDNVSLIFCENLMNNFVILYTLLIVKSGNVGLHIDGVDGSADVMAKNICLNRLHVRPVGQYITKTEYMYSF